MPRQNTRLPWRSRLLAGSRNERSLPRAPELRNLVAHAEAAPRRNRISRIAASCSSSPPSHRAQLIFELRLILQAQLLRQRGPIGPRPTFYPSVFEPLAIPRENETFAALWLDVIEAGTHVALPLLMYSRSSARSKSTRLPMRWQGMTSRLQAIRTAASLMPRNSAAVPTRIKPSGSGAAGAGSRARTISATRSASASKMSGD